MKKGMVSAILVVVLLWISQAMSMGTDGMFASPWPGQNGVNPFGKEDPEGVPPKVAETTLTSFLSSRAVKAGQELTIQYDLLLASADQNRIEIIEKGTTLSYLLLRVTNEESEETEVVSSGKVSFSMDRSENERCELILRPETTENCLMKVSALMTFADGITMENMTDPFLVYTETEVLSHVNVQDCRSGEQVSLDLMVQGPEGVYTFWIYRAFSTDGGNQYLRDKDPLETFALDSRGQKPHTKRDLTVEAEEKGMIRFEVLVQTPDLAQIQFSSDPVRVKPAAYSV